MVNKSLLFCRKIHLYSSGRKASHSLTELSEKIGSLLPKYFCPVLEINRQYT